MKKLGTMLAVLLSAAIIAAAGYGIFSGYKFISSQWAILNSDWKACLIIIATILIFCTLFISSSIRSYTKKHGLVSTGKVIAYNELVHWYSELQNNNPETLKVANFKEIKNQVTLWGNNNVVKQTNLLYEKLINDKENPAEIMLKADHVFLEVKRELGYRRFGVDRSIV